MSVVAEHAFTSRSTLQKVEAGDTGIGVSIYASVLHALGLLDGLAQVADNASGSIGQALANASLPKHIQLERPSRSFRDGRLRSTYRSGRSHTWSAWREATVSGAQKLFFTYNDAWLKDPDRSSLEPALTRTRA